MNLFLDMETCPDQSTGARQRCIEAVEPPGNYKKPESIAEWKAANAAAVGLENWKKTALDPMTGGILVIFWALDNGELRSVHRTPQGSERQLLTDFAEQLGKDLIQSEGQFRLPRYVGWNVSEFDLRFLAIRCTIFGVKLPFALPVNSRMDGPAVCDLMKIWAGYRGYQKQSTVARALGIELPDETDGAQLWELIERDGIDAALRKCHSDVTVLREIYTRMQPIFGC